jgi:hypothetical protein
MSIWEMPFSSAQVGHRLFDILIVFKIMHVGLLGTFIHLLCWKDKVGIIARWRNNFEIL